MRTELPASKMRREVDLGAPAENGARVAQIDEDEVLWRDEHAAGRCAVSVLI